MGWGDRHHGLRAVQTLPRMRHGETPLFGDVAVEKHPAQEPGGVPGRNHRGEPGRDRFPGRLGLLVLQQVFAQGFHQVLVQPGVCAMRIIHLGHGQGVRACRLLSHGSRSTLYSWQRSRATWFPGPFPGIASLGLGVWGNVQGGRSEPAAAALAFGGLLPASVSRWRWGWVPRGSALLLPWSLVNVTPPRRSPRSLCAAPPAKEHGGSGAGWLCPRPALAALLNYWN